jgi:hypothetical protein
VERLNISPLRWRSSLISTCEPSWRDIAPVDQQMEAVKQDHCRDMEEPGMNVVRLPEEQFPPEDQAVLENLPVAEIVRCVNEVLHAHGIEAQITSFSVMHRRLANCTCAEPSAVVALQGFGRALSRVEVECYDPCVKLGCSSQESTHQ